MAAFASSSVSVTMFEWHSQCHFNCCFIFLSTETSCPRAPLIPLPNEGILLQARNVLPFCYNPPSFVPFREASYILKFLFVYLTLSTLFSFSDTKFYQFSFNFISVSKEDVLPFSSSSNV